MKTSEGAGEMNETSGPMGLPVGTPFDLKEEVTYIVQVVEKRTTMWYTTNAEGKVLSKPADLIRTEGTVFYMEVDSMNIGKLRRTLVDASEPPRAD